MKNQEMNNRIKKAFENSTPDILGSILADCKVEKGSVIPMTEIKKKKSFVPKILAAAAALVLLVAGAFGANMILSENRIVSTVALEVNPSLQIFLNNKEKVVDVKPLNDDGKVVLGDMDLKGSDIDVTVNAIVGSMLKNGYLNDVANSILVSVDNDDAERSAKLQKALSEKINAALNTDTYSGSVLCQTAEHDTELTTLAQQYGISEGKAQLIREIIAKDSTYKYEELAKLSINELNLVARSGKKQLTAAEATGNASEKAYIGAQKAKDIAVADVTSKGKTVVSIDDIEMDYEYGRMIYELEVNIAGGEYEYDIDATTGEILYTEVDRDGDRDDDDDYDDDDDVIVNAGSLITADKALDIALDHAGVSKNNIRDLSRELDEDDGRAVYDIQFESGGYEYDYDISATDGKILESEKERED